MMNVRILFVFLLIILSGCSRNTPGHYSDYFSNYYKGTKTLAPVKATSKEYYIKGCSYKPQEHYEYIAEGLASYYGGRDVFHGRKTSTGERFDKNGLTAAHRTLPLPSVIRVTNLENGRSVRLKVNDRGPFAETDDRILDVSERAAKILGFHGRGLARVRIESCVDDSVRVARGAPVFIDHAPPTYTFAHKTPPRLLLAKRQTTAGRSRSPIRVAYNTRSNRVLNRIASQKARAPQMRAMPRSKRVIQRSTSISSKQRAANRIIHRVKALPSRKSRRIS